MSILHFLHNKRDAQPFTIQGLLKLQDSALALTDADHSNGTGSKSQIKQVYNEVWYSQG